jgi:heat shock protein HslJ
VRLSIAVSSLFVLVAAGCGGDGGADVSQLESTPWVLTSGRDLTLPEGVAPSATFANGRVSGSTGCNEYSGPYKVDGDSLEIGDIASTLIACPPPPDAIEKAYIEALGLVASWAIDDEQLVLSGGDGNELLRYEVASLVGEWTVTGVLSGDAFASPITGTELTATLAENGALTGSAGCNNYTTSYTVDGDTIDIDPAAATRKFCAEPKGVMDQEAAHLAALDHAAQYELVGKTAALLSAGGQRLVTYARSR